MKVIDLQHYRALQEVRLLEEKVGRLALETSIGTARQLKLCFKEWLKLTAS